MKPLMVSSKTVFDKIPPLWWSFYAFVFPMLFWIGNSIEYTLYFSGRFFLNIFSVLFIFFVELKSVQSTKKTDWLALFTYLKQNPAIILVSLYGTWVVFSGFFTKNPTVALTGSTNINSGLPISFGSSIWELLFCLVFILIYIRAQKQESLKDQIFSITSIVGAIISVLALVETIMGQGLFSGVKNTDNQIPYVFFIGRGHLAGFLSISFVCSLLCNKKFKYQELLTYFICFGIGLTQNRGTLLAIGIILVLFIFHKEKNIILIFALSVLSTLLGLLISQQLLFADTNPLARDGGNLTSGRQILWKAALGGIRVEPLFGYGGSNFEYYWANYVSKEELNLFVNGYVKGSTYVKHTGVFFVLKDKTGKTVFARVFPWYAHNIFLDKTLQYGIPGMILYFSIIVLAIKNGLKDKTYLVILVYQIYLLTWYMTEASQGTYWAMLALVCATSATRENSHEVEGEVKVITSPPFVSNQ